MTMLEALIDSRERLGQAQCLVVKVGSSLLASLVGGLDEPFILKLCAQIATLRERGKQVVLVSSGAVAAGCAQLGLTRRPTSLPTIQAAAAVGQTELMRVYKTIFAMYRIQVGQVLLTRDGLEDRQRFLRARNTFGELLSLGVLPIVNENDTVAVEELKLKVGDNDRLAVNVATMVGADALLLLTDVPGLYDRPPSEEQAALISHVGRVTPEILGVAGAGGSGLGSGGMASKLSAAQASTMASIPLVVAPGRRENVLLDLLDGHEVGTFFAPREKRTAARLHWIAFGRAPDATLVVDDGARAALQDQHRSLLAIGVLELRGQFNEGDTVSVEDRNGQELARGLVNFSSDELERIRGHKSQDFATLLGYDACETVLHRDNLVVL